MAGSLRLSGNQFHIAGPGHKKSPPTITAETMARHDKKTSTGTEKMLAGGDTGDSWAKISMQGNKEVETKLLWKMIHSVI